LAADENDVERSGAASNFSCPGCGSSCVSRSQMRGHNLIPELKRLAIKNDFVWFNRRKKQPVTESKVAMAAVAQQIGVAFAGNKFCAGYLLELSQTPSVIVVRMAVEQIFYVAQFETELRDVALDLRGRFDKTAINQEMTLWRRD